MQRQHIGNQFSKFIKSGSLLSILIIVNVAVWALMLLLPLVDYLYNMPAGRSSEACNEWLALSSKWEGLLRHPWTLLTYMFIHDSFWHILFNMLMLYVGGVMCCRYLSIRRFGWIYFLSGIGGALLYLLVYNLFPVGQTHISTLVGASAAVLGVFLAVTVYVPNQELSFWLIRTFSIKIKYIAIAFVVIDLLSIPASNAGGHIAHIGGALTGVLYVIFMRQTAKWQTKSSSKSGSIKIKKQHKKKKQESAGQGRPLSDDEYNRRRAEEQKRIDAILDKISKSGYEHLSKEEKDFLFRFGK